jgi:hypothetical protein
VSQRNRPHNAPVRLTDEQHETLRRLAGQRDMSMAQFLRQPLLSSGRELEHA